MLSARRAPPQSRHSCEAVQILILVQENASVHTIPCCMLSARRAPPQSPHCPPTTPIVFNALVQLTPHDLQCARLMNPQSKQALLDNGSTSSCLSVLSRASCPEPRSQSNVRVSGILISSLVRPIADLICSLEWKEDRSNCHSTAKGDM